MRTEVRFRAVATVVLLVTCAVAPLRAQDLARDLPWRRPDPALSSTELLDAGLERLAAGWGWEAARMFRELAHREPERAIAHLALALSLRSNNNRAARLVWQANKFVGKAPAPEAAIVAAYREYFGVDRQPELVDAGFQKEPVERAETLIARLREIDGSLAARLAGFEQARTLGPKTRAGCDGDSSPSLATFEAFYSAANGYMRRMAAMPFLVPGYSESVGGLGSARLDLNTRVAPRLPRHPQLHFPRLWLPDGHLSKLTALMGGSEAGLEWQPRQAPAFDLPRGLNGRGKLADYAGKPVLVVFFLGFG